MDGVRYSEHEIDSGNARIVISVWEPQQQPEANIVFIPATMLHALFYEQLLSGFAAHGFAVFGLHPVGHGKSPRDTKRYTISDIVQNSRDAVTFALERYQLPVIVIGSSQGGLVAAELAAEDERIAAVFANNIMLAELPQSISITKFPQFIRFIYRPVQTAMKIMAKLSPDSTMPLSFYLKGERVSSDHRIWEMVEKDELCLSRYSLYFLNSLFTTRFTGLTDGSIRCPVFILANSGDKLFTSSYIKLVFERIKAERKEIVPFNFGDHMIMVTHPKEICDALTDIILKFGYTKRQQLLDRNDSA